MACLVDAMRHMLEHHGDDHHDAVRGGAGLSVASVPPLIPQLHFPALSPPSHPVSNAGFSWSPSGTCRDFLLSSYWQ